MKASFTPRTSSLLNRRRLMGHVVLGGAAALVLSACGGGSDGGSSADGTSVQEAKLIAAYEKLEDGMVWTDVETLVGFPANNERYETILIWVVGSTRLSVEFHNTGSKRIQTSTLKSGSSPSVARSFS